MLEIEGIYNVVFEKCYLRETKTNKPMVSMALRVQDGDFKDEAIYINQMLTGQLLLLQMLEFLDKPMEDAGIWKSFSDTFPHEMCKNFDILEDSLMALQKAEKKVYSIALIKKECWLNVFRKFGLQYTAYDNGTIKIREPYKEIEEWDN